jgi:biopolymer transport protein ExbB/TolQ
VHHVTALIAMLAKGGLVMIPLLVCSVLSLAVIIERSGFWAQLTERLRALREKKPEVVVVVSADGDVTHRRVVEAMDAARAAGISRMAIAVQPMEKR